MRTFLCALSGLLVVFMSRPAVFAEQRTITGKVIDLTCYSMNKEDVGMDHVSQGSLHPPNRGFACAYSCVRWQGMPAGLLTDDGSTYQIAGGLAANSNLKIAQHLTETVRITGDVTEVAGVMLIAADDLTVIEPAR